MRIDPFPPGDDPDDFEDEEEEGPDYELPDLDDD